MEMRILCHCTTTVLLYLIVPTINNMEKRYGQSSMQQIRLVLLAPEESKACIHAFSCWASNAQRSEQSYCYCDFYLHVSQCQLLQPTMMSWLLNVSTAHYFMRLNALHRSLDPARSFYPTPNHLKSFCFAISKTLPEKICLLFLYTKPHWHLNVKT